MRQPSERFTTGRSVNEASSRIRGLVCARYSGSRDRVVKGLWERRRTSARMCNSLEERAGSSPAFDAVALICLAWLVVQEETSRDSSLSRLG